MGQFIKCIFGYHEWVYYFTPFFTYPQSGMQIGYEDKVCYHCGKH